MGICICCCCNKQKTECLETTLIIFQSIEFVVLILALLLIDWNIASKPALVINVIIFLYVIFNLITIILFKIFREQEKIYNEHKKLCTIIAYISLFYSILSIFLSIISESIISEKIYEYDHPCLYRLSEINNGNTRLLAVNDEDLIKNYCDSLIYVEDFFWHNRRSAYKDIIMSYVCSSIIQIFSLLSTFFYYNEMKRIQYCVKGRMNEEKGVIKYGQLGGYLGKVGEMKEIKRIINTEESLQKGKETNVVNIINANKNISEDNSMAWNIDKRKNKEKENENEPEKEDMKEFDDISLSGKNTSSKDNKPPDEMSNDLKLFY